LLLRGFFDAFVFEQPVGRRDRVYTWRCLADGTVFVKRVGNSHDIHQYLSAIARIRGFGSPFAASLWLSWVAGCDDGWPGFLDMIVQLRCARIRTAIDAQDIQGTSAAEIKPRSDTDAIAACEM